MENITPNWRVYHLILKLIEVSKWGNMDCRYFRRLQEIATEILPTLEEVGVQEALKSPQKPTDAQGKRIAVILAKQATERHWEPERDKGVWWPSIRQLG